MVAGLGRGAVEEADDKSEALDGLAFALVEVEGVDLGINVFALVFEGADEVELDIAFERSGAAGGGDFPVFHGDVHLFGEHAEGHFVDGGGEQIDDAGVVLLGVLEEGAVFALHAGFGGPSTERLDVTLDLGEIGGEFSAGAAGDGDGGEGEDARKAETRDGSGEAQAGIGEPQDRLHGHRRQLGIYCRR